MGNLEGVLPIEAGGESFLSQVKRGSERLAERYFKPNFLDKSKIFHKYTGAKLFGKYWINGGSKSGITSFTIGESSYEKIRTLDFTTKVVELVHLGTFGSFLISDAPQYLEGDLSAIALNYLVNVLPILNMRHVRSRTKPLLDRLKKKKNNSSSK